MINIVKTVPLYSGAKLLFLIFGFEKTRYIKCHIIITPIDLEMFLVKLEIWYFQLKEESTKTFSLIAFLLILMVTCCFNGLLYG